uniref:Tumor necrosis factor receptor superfamily member 6 n=2 Tax=Pipistrellus kuhlii TaxID=59472 RepID=A0A7J7VB04_PIPKU|nr:Fas cell surface death receptor [Pipistrellus kuhlii]
MPRIGVLLLLILAILAESTKDNSPVTNTYSEPLKPSKNITKRESGCPEGQQRQGSFCCLPCLPGERKKDDCKAHGDKLVCEPCQEGKEYTDKEHFSSTCRRCGICDGEHGVNMESLRIAQQPVTPDVKKDPHLTHTWRGSCSWFQ